MLPLHISEDRRGIGNAFQNGRSFSEYISMALHYAQLDLDYTFAQMCYLCVAPKKVYQLTCYRKQTKNRWSRDDPAFVVITMIFLFIVSVAYSLAFQTNLFRVLFWSILVHYVILGLIIATVFTYVCNNYLRLSPIHGGHFVRQTLEWQYAWDIHCNSFVLVLLIVYVLQYLLLPILYDDSGAARALDDARSRQILALGEGGATTVNSSDKSQQPSASNPAAASPAPTGENRLLRLLSSSASESAGSSSSDSSESFTSGPNSLPSSTNNHMTTSPNLQLATELLPYFNPSLLSSPSLISCFLSNMLFAVSLIAYFYISWMGYSVLPFLEKSETLLYPCVGLLIIIILLIVMRINLTVWFIWLIVWSPSCVDRLDPIIKSI